MTEPATISLYCTGCKRPTPHEFVGAHVSGHFRYQCQACGRAKLLMPTEKRT